MSSLLRLNADARFDALAALAEQMLGAKLLRLESIPPGLGNRRFFRLYFDEGEAPTHLARAIARVEAEEDPEKRAAGVAPEPDLEPLRRYLEQRGVPVPKCYGTDTESMVALIEDVGSESLEDAAHEVGAEERIDLYREACGLIPRLQALEAPDPPLPAFERHLDRALFESKATRVIEWALPWWLGRAPDRAEREVVQHAFSAVADACQGAPARLSHRDLKAANIHVDRGAPPGDRLTLIDLQGAFMAPPEYDLVCLLRDSHVALPDEEVARHLETTRPELPDAPAPDEFDRRFTLLTLSRVAKDAAHYIHASTHRADDRYLPLLPTARAVLCDASTHAAQLDPALERLADLIHALREPEPRAGGSTR